MGKPLDEKLAQTSSDAEAKAATMTEQGNTTGGTEPTTSQAPEPTYLSGVKLLLVSIGLTVVMLLAMLDISILGTAIPQMTSDFRTLTDVGWYVGAYQLASSTCQPLTGKLYTHFNSKWTYLSSLLLFEIGSAICGAATSSVMFIIGRAIAGMGAAGLTNGALTIILIAFKPETRPMYTGLTMGIGQVGLVLGPVLGGAFTEHATWRWCFYINLPLGFLAGIFISFIHIPEPPTKGPVTLNRGLIRRFDLPGFAIFAPASIMLLLALQYASDDFSWDSAMVIGLLCGAVVTACIFLYWEHRMGNDAMIPLNMLKRRHVWTSYVYFGGFMSVVIVGGNFMPIYLQSVKGLSPLTSGVYLLASILTQILSILVSGALLQKSGYYMPWALAAAAFMAIACGLISTWTPTTDLGKLIGYQILLGARGPGMQVPAISVQRALPPEQVAVGTSALVFSGNFFSAIFITVANTIFQETLVSQIHTNAPEVSVEGAIAAGGSAEAVRALAPPGPVLDAILDSYSTSFSHVMYLLLSLSMMAFGAALGLGWVDMRVKPEPVENENEAKRDEES